MNNNSHENMFARNEVRLMTSLSILKWSSKDNDMQISVIYAELQMDTKVRCFIVIIYACIFARQ